MANTRKIADIIEKANALHHKELDFGNVVKYAVQNPTATGNNRAISH